MASMTGSVSAPLSVPGDFDHPFYPIDLKVSGYIVTSMSGPVLLAIFFTGIAALLACTRAFLRRKCQHLCRGETWTAMWFILCGFIHLFFEGYFSYNALDLVRRNDLFGQLWKEYALSDSRYMTKDAFIICMETVTAFVWGPLSFLCAYYITNGHPLRHPLQLIVSLGQLYGLILYFGTCALEQLIHGIIFCRPEYFYYCAYYLACNLFWLFLPAWLIYQSAREISWAFGTLKKGKKE